MCHTGKNCFECKDKFSLIVLTKVDRGSHEKGTDFKITFKMSQVYNTSLILCWAWYWCLYQCIPNCSCTNKATFFFFPVVVDRRWCVSRGPGLQSGSAGKEWQWSSQAGSGQWGHKSKDLQISSGERFWFEIELI